MKRYFITGTDTDCGKTYVTSSLLRYFDQTEAIKPIASGCIEVDGQLVSTDAQQLQKNSDLSLDVINPWRFKLPLSPHIAAKEQGEYVSAKEIADYCLNIQLEGIERLFIEGAGGLMVPLNDSETWIDFLKMTEIPVILVVGMKLGCINHAILTSLVLQSYNIPCAGWIANCIDPQLLHLSANIETLKSRINAPLLTTLSFSGEVEGMHECLL